MTAYPLTPSSLTHCPDCRRALRWTNGGVHPATCPSCTGALALSPAGRRCREAKARVEAVLNAATPWPPLPAIGPAPNYALDND